MCNIDHSQDKDLLEAMRHQLYGWDGSVEDAHQWLFEREEMRAFGSRCYDKETFSVDTNEAARAWIDRDKKESALIDRPAKTR